MLCVLLLPARPLPSSRRPRLTAALPALPPPPPPACPQPDSAGGMDQGACMSLFGLTDFAALQEPSTQTRAVLGWRPAGGAGAPATVVLAFRGTQSLSNVLSDVKAWSVRWRGSYLVRVHAGAGGGAGGGGRLVVHAAPGGSSGLRAWQPPHAAPASTCLHLSGPL